MLTVGVPIAGGLSGPVWACLGLSGLSGPVWACLALSGPVWACLGLSEPVWACLGLSGPVWARLACLGLSGPVWAWPGLSEPVWACLGLSGPVWACLGLSGPGWKTAKAAYTRQTYDTASDFRESWNRASIKPISCKEQLNNLGAFCGEGGAQGIVPGIGDPGKQ